MKWTSHLTPLLVFNLFLLPAVTIEAQEICPEFKQFAEEAMPRQVGDREWMSTALKPEIARPQLGEGFDPTRAQRVIRDRLYMESDGSKRGTDPFTRHEKQTHRGRQGSVMRIDLARGKIAYLNRQRGHDALSGKENEISEEEAIEIAANALKTFGVPVSEVDRRNLETRVLVAAGRDSRGGEPTRRRAEVHVRVPRQVGNIPVFDSFLRTAVNAKGEIARLSVQWPDFALVPGLMVENTLTREEVTGLLLERLAESHLCGTLSNLVLKIAYVQADQLAVSSTEADEGDRENSTADRGYLPALVVYGVPVEPEEDSGEISMGAQQFVIPLLQAKIDRVNR